MDTFDAISIGIFATVASGMLFHEWKNRPHRKLRKLPRGPIEELPRGVDVCISGTLERSVDSLEATPEG